MTRLSIAAVFLGVSLMLMGLFSVTPFGTKADRYAVELSEDSIKTFLALRALNAGLSLAQEVEFTGSVGLFSGSAQPLKILEPLDDAVEYLSTAVFIAGSFAVVVASTLHIAGPLGLIIVGLGLTLSGLSGSKFMPFQLAQTASAISSRAIRAGATLYLLVISFAFASLVNQAIGDAAWSKHRAVLEEVAEEMRAIDLQPDGNLSGILDEAASLEEPIANPSAGSEDEEAEDATGILGSITNFGRSTASAAGDYISEKREAASDGVAYLKEGAARAVHFSRVSATTAEVILRNADDLMVAFFAILAAYIFKLMVLPILAFVVLSRLIKGNG